MNVLRLINTMDPKSGGPCQGIRNSLPEWEKAGHSTTIITLDNPDLQFSDRDSLPLVVIGPAFTSWGYSKKLAPWLVRHLTEFDVVIVHGLWQYKTYAINKIMRKLKRQRPKLPLPKVYLMPHGMLDPYFQKSPDRKVKAVRNYLYWKLIESNVIKNADGVLFTCEEELLQARTTFKPYNPKKELNVGYGIPSPPEYSDRIKSAFNSKFPNLTDNTYFLFLSRIHPKKGADILLKVYLKLYKEASLKGIKLPLLLIAGPGIETNYGKSLLQFVQHNQLQSSVIFAGMLTGDLKWGAFYGCEAYILPSHQENFGLSVVEALACMKPVIVSNQVNIWREIQSADSGIVDEDTEQGLTRSLELWGSLSESDKSRKGINALNAFHAHFNVSQATNRMMKLLNLNDA